MSLTIYPVPEFRSCQVRPWLVCSQDEESRRRTWTSFLRTVGLENGPLSDVMFSGSLAAVSASWYLLRPPVREHILLGCRILTPCGHRRPLPFLLHSRIRTEKPGQTPEPTAPVEDPPLQGFLGQCERKTNENLKKNQPTLTPGWESQNKISHSPASTKDLWDGGTWVLNSQVHG